MYPSTFAHIRDDYDPPSTAYIAAARQIATSGTRRGRATRRRRFARSLGLAPHLTRGRATPSTGPC